MLLAWIGCSNQIGRDGPFFTSPQKVEIVSFHIFPLHFFRVFLRVFLQVGQCFNSVRYIHVSVTHDRLAQAATIATASNRMSWPSWSEARDVVPTAMVRSHGRDEAGWWLAVFVVFLGNCLLMQKMCFCKTYVYSFIYIYILHLDTWENMNITLLLVGTVMFLK